MIRRILILTLSACGVAAIALIGPREVVSLQQKSLPADLDMSPMGRIAAGLDPAPEISVEPDQSFLATRAPSRLSAGGGDKLVHSPLAPDFQSETTIAKNGDWIVVGYNDVRGFAL